MVSKVWVGVVVLLVVAVACQPAVEPAAESGEAAPATEAAEPDDSAVIYEMMDGIAAAWNAGDLEGTLAFFAQEFTQMPPGEDARVGLEVTAARWREVLDENTDQWVPTITEVQIVDDLAFARVSATQTRTPLDGGEPAVTENVGLAIFRRQADDSWPMVFEYWLPKQTADESEEAAPAIQGSRTDENAVIYEILERMSATWNAGDLEGNLALFADEFTQMPPGEDALVGLDTIAATWREFREENENTWEPWVAEVQIVGDLAFARGSDRQVTTPRAGGESEVTEQFSLWVFRQQSDGSWLMIFEHLMLKE